MAGKAIARLNALRHGLNTPEPDCVAQARADRYRDLVDHARAGPDPAADPDLVYTLVAHIRLRAHRAELTKSILEAGASKDPSAWSDLSRTLDELGRLYGYERKSASRLGGLLKTPLGFVGETKPRIPSARLRSLTS